MSIDSTGPSPRETSCRCLASILPFWHLRAQGFHIATSWIRIFFPSAMAGVVEEQGISWDPRVTRIVIPTIDPTAVLQLATLWFRIMWISKLEGEAETGSSLCSQNDINKIYTNHACLLHIATTPGTQRTKNLSPHDVSVHYAKSTQTVPTYPWHLFLSQFHPLSRCQWFSLIQPLKHRISANRVKIKLSRLL